jgi:hypothetical protein
VLTSGQRKWNNLLAKIREDMAEELSIVEKTNVCVTVNYNVCKSASALCDLRVSVIKSECVTKC